MNKALRVCDIWYALKPSPPLSPDDSLAKAARLFRARSTPTLLVAEGPRLTGVVHESDLLDLAADAPDPAALMRGGRIAHAMRPIDLFLSSNQSLVSAAEMMAGERLEALPVMDAGGHYLGMLLRRDVLAAISGEPVVSLIAGLATPFGVHLTTGALRAGASDLALALFGASLMAMNLLAIGAVVVLRHIWPALQRASESGPTADIVSVALALVQVGLFLLLLRFSPVPGIHAGEHMVVHAIEEGEDLTLEKVRAMPRAHPRCGTNLAALLVMVAAAWELVITLARRNSGAGTVVFFALVVVALFTWRRLGHGLQKWITTRPPSDRQLQRAVGVGQELLRKISEHPGARVKPLRRLWNAGFLQVVAGAAALMAFAHYALRLL